MSIDRNIVLLIYFGFCILGPCWVFAACAKASINALGRNPHSAPRIFTAMIVVLFFTEVVSFIAMLIGYQLFGM